MRTSLWSQKSILRMTRIQRFIPLMMRICVGCGRGMMLVRTFVNNDISLLKEVYHSERSCQIKKLVFDHATLRDLVRMRMIGHGADNP